MRDRCWASWAPGVVESDGILFQGEDISKKSEREMMKIRGKAISMVFQDPMTSLNPLYTIEKQITEMLDLHQKQMTKQEKHARCVELLHMVGIPNPEDRLKSYPHQFSGGMRQRVIIAIALAANPKLIIADEPTTALDVTIQAQILKLMDKLVKEQDASLILITHDLAVVSQMADRIIVMYCGKIVESGSPAPAIRIPRDFLTPSPEWERSKNVWNPFRVWSPVCWICPKDVTLLPDANTARIFAVPWRLKTMRLARGIVRLATFR